MTDSVKTELRRISPEILFAEPMRDHTTFKIGGPADAFAQAHSPDEAAALIRFCRQNDLPFLITGNGSNMLVSDAGIRGVVIAVKDGMNAVETDGCEVRAQAGALLSRTAAEAARAGLSGLEFASGIPGTVGGGVFMNAGAYGGELKDVIKSVTYMDLDGVIYTRGPESLGFGYRKSIFSQGAYVILSCVFSLKKDCAEDISARMKEYSRRRSEKQPLSEPSAGSAFKRPEGYFAGKLIQDCGLMGYRIGGAAVSEKHAGFIVNKGGATCRDVTRLIAHVQNAVMEKFGVRLEPEVRICGELL